MNLFPFLNLRFTQSHMLIKKFNKLPNQVFFYLTRSPGKYELRPTLPFWHENGKPLFNHYQIRNEKTDCSLSCIFTHC